MKIYRKYQGHCAYCGKQMVYSEMQIDHIVPKLNGYMPSEYVEKMEVDT